LRNQKQYSLFLSAIDLANSFFADSSMHFADAVKLYSSLAPMLFNERYLSDQ